MDPRPQTHGMTASQRQSGGNGTPRGTVMVTAGSGAGCSSTQQWTSGIVSLIPNISGNPALFALTTGGVDYDEARFDDGESRARKQFHCTGFVTGEDLLAEPHELKQVQTAIEQYDLKKRRCYESRARGASFRRFAEQKEVHSQVHK